MVIMNNHSPVFPTCDVMKDRSPPEGLRECMAYPWLLLYITKITYRSSTSRGLIGRAKDGLSSSHLSDGYMLTNQINVITLLADLISI